VLSPQFEDLMQDLLGEIRSIPLFFFHVKTSFPLKFAMHGRTHA
jgi:hypothetical protein